MSLSFKKQEDELPSATYTSLQETLVRQSAGQFSAETDEEPAAAQQAAALPENSRSDSAKAQQSAPVTFGTGAADGNAGNSAAGDPETTAPVPAPAAETETEYRDETSLPAAVAAAVTFPGAQAGGDALPDPVQLRPAGNSGLTAEGDAPAAVGDLITEILPGETVADPFIGGVLYTDAGEPVPSIAGSIIVRGGGAEDAPVSITGDFTGGSKIVYDGSSVYPHDLHAVTGSVVIDLSYAAFTGTAGSIVMGGRVSGAADNTPETGDAGGMEISGGVEVKLSDTDLGKNHLFPGVLVENGGYAAIRSGVKGTFHNVAAAPIDDYSISCIMGAAVKNEGSRFSIDGGIELIFTDSRLQGVFGYGVHPESHTGGSGNTVSRAAGKEHAIRIALENTSFFCIAGAAAGGTVNGNIDISADNASKGKNNWGDFYRTGITGIGSGDNLYLPIGAVTVNGDISLSLFDDSCNTVYGGYFFTNTGDAGFVNGNISITIRDSGSRGDDYYGWLNVYGGIYGTYIEAPAEGAPNPVSAEVTGRIVLEVDGHNFSNITAGGPHSVGSGLTDGGAAIRTLFTGGLTVNGDFLGGTLSSEYFDITIHGDITVGTAEGITAKLVFNNNFTGGFQARNDYGTTIDGAVTVDLDNASFIGRNYNGGLFTGGGLVTGGNYGEERPAGVVTVKNGIRITLNNTVFENPANHSLTHVLGVRVEGGSVVVQNGVDCTLNNVQFLGLEDLDPEYPIQNPGEVIPHDKLVGGGVDENASGKAEIRGTVSVTVTGSSLKLFYGGGYSAFAYSTGENKPVDSYRRREAEADFYKVVTVSSGDASRPAVDLKLDGTSFAAVSGGGRNIEVIGDVVLHFDNTPGNDKAAGEIIYGSGIGIWHKGDVDLTVTGGYNITDRLVGGGGGSSEILKQRLDENGYPVYDEDGQEIYDPTGVRDALLGGNVTITLSGGSTFNTVYGGSDCVGINETGPENIPALLSARSTPAPDRVLSVYGRPTEITGRILVNLNDVTINTYVGAGLGTVGRDVAGTTVVATQFGSGTSVRNFTGGSLFTDYMQGNPVLHGDVKVTGGGGRNTIVSGGFTAGSKVLHAEEILRSEHDEPVEITGQGSYEYVGHGSGDYDYGYLYLYDPDNPDCSYTKDPDTGEFTYVGYGKGDYWEYYTHIRVGEGNGSYAFDPAGTGSYYVIERKEAVIGELGHHTITGSVIADLKNFEFTGDGLLLTGGGEVDGLNKNEGHLQYRIEGGTDISLNGVLFNSNRFAGAMHVKDKGCGRIAGTAKTVLSNAVFGAGPADEPALVLGAYAVNGSRAEIGGGINGTLNDVDLSNRSGSVVFGGSAASGGSVADLAGNVSLTISGENGKYGTVYGGSGRLDDASSADIAGNVNLTVTGGTFTGNIVAGSKNGLITGDVTASIGGRALGWIIGGSENRIVDGSIDLSLTGEFDYIVFGGGLGTGAGVTGDITLTVTGKSGARNGMIYAGGNGDVGIESRREGTRITVTVNSNEHGEAYHLFLGTSANSSAPGDSTIYGDVYLDYIANGVTDRTAETGSVYGGSRRTGVAGDSVITGKAVLNFGEVYINNLFFGGGYATASGQSVRVVTEGGVLINLNNTKATEAAIMAGGIATGSGAQAVIGTEQTRAGARLNLTGSTTVDVIHGGGYGISRGRSVICGDSVITIDSDNVTTDLIHGGGYANGGIDVIRGKAVISITASASTNYIHGGGYAIGSGVSAVTDGVEIHLSNYRHRPEVPMVVYAGGRNAMGGTAYVGADENGTENIHSAGTLVTADAGVRLWHIYGGGYSEGPGTTTVYGGTRIVINGAVIAGENGSAGFLYGGGHVFNRTGNYSIVNGGTNITVNGGTLGYVYGGGSTYYADAAADLSIVNGGTSITLNSADSVLTINNYVCGGGNRSATVYGGTRIEFTGLGDNLNFTSYVIGSNNRNQNTYGEKELVFNGFTGSFNAKIAYFDTITISGSAVNWTKSQTLAEVSEWNFDLSGSDPALTWENGTNDFSGDTLNLTFGGAYTGGVVFSGSGATLTGWESVGAVNIGGSAAVRDGSVWRVAGAWELSRNADNQLILSKLA